MPAAIHSAPSVPCRWQASDNSEHKESSREAQSFVATRIARHHSGPDIWSGSVLTPTAGGEVMSGKGGYQLSNAAAQEYENVKVPALFRPMAEQMLDAIALPAGGDVLDVACGTGVVARAVGDRLTERSRLVGVDITAGMIEVARQHTPVASHTFEWHVASAEDMPFDDASFDLAFCQQGMQFVPDKPAALAEIRRALRAGGRFILNCWAAVPPMFTVVAEVVGRRLSEEVAKSVGTPFAWRDQEVISGLIADAGFDVSAPRRLNVFRRLPATQDGIRNDLLASQIEPALRAVGDGEIELIVQEVLDGVESYRTGEMLALPQEAHLFEVNAR